MVPAIAIVGMGCCYPDARSLHELWENVLAGRRAFRRIPPERLRVEDYFSPDREAPDSIYSAEAALIEGYEFDRVGFRVAGGTFRAADMAHWLALDVAAQSLSDGGFEGGAGLPAETTAVFLGNTLTGEFSRAGVMRLRWPYVRRLTEEALQAESWDGERRAAFLEKLEAAYKEPFPAVGAESLAGGLSNTIAGRICNHFDLKGGGYTIDGACASSLLAVANACSALAAGDVDVALAGGVDLSIDPFELVGFSKAGALASGLMRVYDARSDGFAPGEGCGFVVLMRQEDALAERRRVYATVRGWGVSSDGRGGITRPEVEGQGLALQRAYKRAGFGIETVAYFEGHGTGTSVGDATELKALSQARRRAARDAPPAAIGSIKANIGHTKAAAGVAGLIKATLAVHTGILPPTTGCDEPHAELRGDAPALLTLREGRRWPEGVSRRAGVSSMGFGGINAHVVLEGDARAARPTFSNREKALLSSHQDAEIFLLAAADAEGMRRQLARLLSFAARISRAELGDLSARLERDLDDHQRVRAAVVASSPAELAERLSQLDSVIDGDATTHIDARAGVFFNRAATARPRVGLLFTGQGVAASPDGGILRRRFACVGELYERAHLADSGDRVATEFAQPAIVTASLAGLLTLERLDIEASVAVGHSLGELTALHWGGALSEAALLRVARVRGRAMSAPPETAGTMASIAAGRREVEALINGDRVVVAGVNAPFQTILSGEKAAVETVVARALSRKLHAVPLPVSNAFHSPLVASAVPPLSEQLSREEFQPLRRAVVSTVTGERLPADAALGDLLKRQITSPVLFMQAFEAAAREGVDLWVEVGPGSVLGRLAAELSDTPAVSLDAGGDSLGGLLLAVAAAYALGGSVNHRALFAERFTRPFDLDWKPRFFVNPCEQAWLGREVDAPAPRPAPPVRVAAKAEEVEAPLAPADASTLELVIELVARRCELPASAVSPAQGLLSDLHLNSITVGQLVADAARRLGLPRPVVPTGMAGATVGEVAAALDEQRRAGHTSEVDEYIAPPGFDVWTRPFTVELIEEPLSRREASAAAGEWRVFAPEGHELAEALRRALADCGEGHGAVVCLPPDPEERHVRLLLEGARAVSAAGEGARFVLVQHGGGAAAFARTLRLEMQGVVTCVVDVPADAPEATRWVVAEALAATEHVEAHYDAGGLRRVPVWRHLPTDDLAADSPLNADDVLVVTGGGKGITAECALSLGQATGARLAIIGTALPGSDEELSNTLRRMGAAGLRFRYYPTDITDGTAVRDAFRRIRAELGEVTAILHGAARNQPKLLAQHDEESFRKTLAVKVGGARNLLAAADPERLRTFITFGSIIARTGLPGEADYGLANEWLTRVAERWQAQHPHCRSVAIEWSVWSGVGMGERLASVDVLVRQGIVPITPERGVPLLHELLTRRPPAVAVVVTGRYRERPTFRFERQELPFLRFLERAEVFYPGLELVAEAELSAGNDPYLEDHRLQGERLLPAVIGLEAMAQAASALTDATRPPVFEEVTFDRPVVVPQGSPLKIRLAALVRAPGVVDVALRSEETSFQVDHFKATCRFDTSASGNGEARPQPVTADVAAGVEHRVELDPERDLYGDILFHTGRFRRVKGYRSLSARECLAELTPDDASPWFSRYLPGGLLLGNPARRDATIHAIQACIPHATLLPVGAERISILEAAPPSPDGFLVRARERTRVGDLFTYDVEVLTVEGILIERWDGMRLRALNYASPRGPLAEPLLAPYAERRVRDLVAGADVSLALRREGCARRGERSDKAVLSALGEDAALFRRADGKVVTTGREVSASHCGGLTLAAAGRGALGCDIERVSERSDETWRDLLGEGPFALAGLVASSAGEGEGASRTRVWAAGECLRKAGASLDAPLLYQSTAPDGWVLLTSGRLSIATLVTSLRGSDERLALSVLVEGGAQGEHRVGTFH
ncbi:MAG TPA: type I polyketide synthase [Pyrinomonadaceae bacterium]|nr:type I polyketide synthase [Pyrinomonadaceae bacterium]